MEDINPEFATTDVVLVVSANDVVNPAIKRIFPSHFCLPYPWSGKCKNVIIMKRSMKAGYAGIDSTIIL